MRIMSGLVCLGGAMLMLNSAVATAAHHEESASDAVSASSVDVIGGDGKVIGSVALTQTPNGVLIAAKIEGLPAGEHGFHIHEKGVCDAADGFKSAGGHYAPNGHDHGIKEATGPHAGDMPNQFVGEDGVLEAHVLNSAVTLGEGSNSLNDADGSALMVHSGADDYISQPSGAAGSRIACAVLSPPKPE